MKTNDPNQRKWQKTQFWDQFWSLKFFLWVLPPLDVMHCCKLSLYATAMEPNELNLRKWEKKLALGPTLAPLAQSLVPKHFFVDFTSPRCYVTSRKTNKPNLRKWQKTWFGSNFGPLGPNLGCQFFPQKICLHHSRALSKQFWCPVDGTKNSIF